MELLLLYTNISAVLFGLSVPYNKIIIFNSDLNLITYLNMGLPSPPPPNKKCSSHVLGKSVRTFQNMHEEEICFPSQDSQEILQLIVLPSPASKNWNNNGRIN
jgi:hypothetical protein